MNKYAIVLEDQVLNVVVWDGESTWTPPAGATLVEVTGVPCGPGWTYTLGAFVPPELPQDEEV
jgi:hypothetical protein